VDNFLYLNRSAPGRLRFAEVGLAAGAARDDRGSANGSMGADAGDPERTGKPSVWVTNYENELHALYRNECTPGRPFFLFRTAAAGIAALGQKYVGWGTGFVDADLDGWGDLAAAQRGRPGSSASGRGRVPGD
jgi:enediyne biosynthesis protein E4